MTEVEVPLYRRRKSRDKVCPKCGRKFRDPSATNTRTYCDEHTVSRTLLEKPVERARRVPGVPFTVSHFRRWSKRFRLKEGTAFKLDRYQALFLEDLFRREPDGSPSFSELWLVVPEGNGKTTFFCLVALYTIEFKPEAWCPVAASARDQAVDLTYRLSSGFVTRNKLQGEFQLHPGYRQIIHKESQGAMKIFASDAASGDGVDPTLALIEELHRLESMELYETWSGKLDKSGGQMIVATTRGEPGSEFEELLQNIRLAATSQDRSRECFVRSVASGVVLHEYGIPEDGDPEDLELVARANPFSAKTVESLRRKRAKPTFRLARWLRFTCNRPTRGEDSAITEAEWFRQTSSRSIPEGVPVWCGLDVGWTIDTTAIVPFWLESEQFRLLGPARILVPPDDGSMLHPDDVKGAFLEVNARNPVECVVMDMTRAEDIAAWLQDELGVTVVDHQQGNPLKVLDYERFMEALRKQVLWHSGDEGLRRHAMNAIARLLPDGSIRFARPKNSRKVSAAQQLRRVVDALDAAASVHMVATAEFYGEPEDEWEVMAASA